MEELLLLHITVLNNTSTNFSLPFFLDNVDIVKLFSAHSLRDKL